MIDKIRHAHPSIRPRVNTPGGLKKPPHLPPAPSKGPAPPLPEEQEELYEEPAADPMPTQQVDTHYLSFEPTHPKNIDEGEEPQEMYEAMAVMEDQDLYEEPGEQPVRCAYRCLCCYGLLGNHLCWLNHIVGLALVSDLVFHGNIFSV